MRYIQCGSQPASASTQTSRSVGWRSKTAPKMNSPVMSWLLRTLPVDAEGRVQAEGTGGEVKGAARPSALHRGGRGPPAREGCAEGSRRREDALDPLVEGEEAARARVASRARLPARVPLEQPDRPRLGVQRFDDALEHPWQELVEVERRVEVERGLVEEAEAVVSGDAYGGHG